MDDCDSVNDVGICFSTWTLHLTPEGLRSRLDNVERTTAGSVLEGEFDLLCSVVVIFNVHGGLGNLNNFFVCQARNISSLCRNLALHRQPGLIVREVFDHLWDDLFLDQLHGALVNDEPVRTDDSSDQRLSQTPGRFDDDLGWVAVDRV